MHTVGQSARRGEVAGGLGVTLPTCLAAPFRAYTRDRRSPARRVRRRRRTRGIGDAPPPLALAVRRWTEHPIWPLPPSRLDELVLPRASSKDTANQCVPQH